VFLGFVINLPSFCGLVFGLHSRFFLFNSWGFLSLVSLFFFFLAFDYSQCSVLVEDLNRTF
jgi:hypothetical protein